MTQRSAILVLAAGSLMACSASDRGAGLQEDPEGSGEPIVNGDVLTDPESRRSPAVSIRFRVQKVDAEGPFTVTRFGSGILIAPNVMLTAAHVVTLEDATEQALGIEVQHVFPRFLRHQREEREPCGAVWGQERGGAQGACR